MDYNGLKILDLIDISKHMTMTSNNYLHIVLQIDQGGAGIIESLKYRLYERKEALNLMYAPVCDCL